MKLSLGTVQFGLDYGITNQLGKTPSKEVSTILNFARKSNVTVLDTAFAYGDSEKVLGNHNLSDFKVITKVAAIQNKLIDSSDIIQMEKAFLNSLNLMGIESVYGLLIHSSGDLDKKNAEMIYEKLNELKLRGLVEKIGVSVYDNAEIDDLYNRYSFDLIQIPINILDQRLLIGKTLQMLKKNNVEIYARSIFLQGTILNKPSTLDSRFKAAFSTLNQYHAELSAQGLSPLEGALLFINQIKEIDYAVVGVNNIVQLKEIYNAYEKVKTDVNTHIDFSQYAIQNEKIIDPRKW